MSKILPETKVFFCVLRHKALGNNGCTVLQCFLSVLSLMKKQSIVSQRACIDTPAVLVYKKVTFYAMKPVLFFFNHVFLFNFF